MNMLRFQTAIALISAIFLLAGCENEERNENVETPTNFTMSVTPTGEEIGQEEALTLTAALDPNPGTAVTFKWDTNATYGKITDEAPFGNFEETTNSGRSTVLYSATPVGNPGGTEGIIVEAIATNGSVLAEGFVEVVVGPPDVQIAEGLFIEYTVEGTSPGRLSTAFLTAWPFFKLPGFNVYNFTLEQVPGESCGCDLGDVGQTLSFGLGSGLVDREILEEGWGLDHFALGDDKWALLIGGFASNNYNPNDPDDLENLDSQRQAAIARASAVYTVTVRTN